MTRADHPTGTDRVAEAAARLAEAAIIVNIQGDEPEIAGTTIDHLIALLEHDPEAPMATLATPIRDEAVYRDPSCVKVVVSAAGRALYFSRSPIPCHRDGLPDFASASAPARLPPPGPLRLPPRLPAEISGLPRSPLEAAEKLEQLRVLEAGHPIAIGVVDESSIGIDTPKTTGVSSSGWNARDS